MYCTLVYLESVKSPLPEASSLFSSVQHTHALIHESPWLFLLACPRPICGSHAHASHTHVCQLSWPRPICGPMHVCSPMCALCAFVCFPGPMLVAPTLRFGLAFVTCLPARKPRLYPPAPSHTPNLVLSSASIACISIRPPKASCTLSTLCTYSPPR